MATQDSSLARIDGRIAVVTGGTQGLGEAVAGLFADRGAAGIVICGRNVDNGHKVAERLSGRGCRTLYVQADLGSVEDCRKVVAAADQAFGRVDTLVNAAGLTDRGTILDTTPELFDRIFSVNVRAPFFLMQEAARIMRREKHARHHRQHPQHVGPWRAAVHHRLLRFERRAADAHQERRVQPDARRHPRERPQHRLDGHARRGPHRAAVPRRPGRLEGEGRGQACPSAACSRWTRWRARSPIWRRDESGLMTGSIIDFDQSVVGCYEAAPQPAHRD